MDKTAYQYENRLIKRSSIRYIFPPMLGLAFAQSAPVVDGICVSRGFGDKALAALSTATPVIYVFYIIAAICGISCGILISRCSGAGEKAKASRVFTRLMILMTAVSLLMSALCMIVIDPLLDFLCATPENYAYAREYLLVILAGSVFMVYNFAGDYILINDNDQNLAMIGDIVGAVVNIAINFAGVYVFHCGIWVVAFGTVFGSFCCCLVYMLHSRKANRLCRFVSPEHVDGDPGLGEMLSAGTAEGIMYAMYAAQVLIQNYVLRGDAGTSGLSNSAIVENLQLIMAIVTVSVSDAVFPMASAYCGEQNRCGMLMVKRALTKLGFLMLLPIVTLLCVFPQLSILPYSIDNPVMIQSLPLAIRLISASSLLSLLDMILINYLSAIEEEGRANLALIIQSIAQISLTLLLDRFFPMDAPWYAAIISSVVVLVYLCFLCNNIAKVCDIFIRRTCSC